MLVNQPTGQVSLLFKECKCLKFAFTEFAQSIRKQLAHNEYEFTFSAQITTNEQEESISIQIDSSLGTLEEPKQQIAELTSSTIFLIQNFRNIIIKIGDNPPGIPDGLVAHLLGLSLSSVRGMYSVKLEGSIFENAIMPTIDPVKMLQSAKQQP